MQRSGTNQREKQDETGQEAAKAIGRLRNDMCTVSKKVTNSRSVLMSRNERLFYSKGKPSDGIKISLVVSLLEKKRERERDNERERERERKRRKTSDDSLARSAS